MRTTVQFRNYHKLMILLLFLAGYGKAAGQTYCSPTFTSTSNNTCINYRLYNVQIGGINNSPLAGNCSVFDYLSTVATLAVNTPAPYSIQLGNYCSFAIYADFNKDGDFNDANEMLVANHPAWSATVETVTGNVTVPTGVAVGTYRMRIVCKWGDDAANPPVGAGQACNTFTLAGSGNYHDYTLNVVPFGTPQPSFTPVRLTGFNADVIVNGVGTSMATTNNDVDGVNYCFLSAGWQFSNSNTPLVGGLPANGLISSLQTTGLTYQLANYSANNVLRINTTTPATLTLTNPITANNVYVLATSGSGTCIMTAQVNFTDNTNQQFTGLNISDWFGATPYEIGQIGRIARNTTSTFPESAFDGPRLYRNVLTISPANQSKKIASIQFTRTSGTGILNVYAASVETTAITCQAPTTPTASAITLTTASLNWTQVGTPALWQIKYGPNGFDPAIAGTSIFTASKPYTLNPPLTSSTTYDFYVRAVCGSNDTSYWSASATFTTGCTMPSILSRKDSSRCGNGTVVLEATTSSDASIKWYTALTGGVAAFTGNIFTTPNLTSNTTYYVSAVSGNCETTPRLPVVATVRTMPVVNLGKDTTICPGVSYTFDAGNAGGTYAWNSGEASQTITRNAAGTYAVQVTLNRCIVSDTIKVTPGIVPVNTLNPSVDLCDGSKANLNAGNQGSTFLWTPSGTTTQTIVTDTGGLFNVRIRSANGCVTTGSSLVIMRPLPIDAVGNDTIICDGDQISLDAGNPGYAYSWSTGARTKVINATDSGAYTVTISTPYNCTLVSEKHIAYVPSPRTEGFNFIPLFYDQLGKVRFSPIRPTDVTGYLWDFGDDTETSDEENPIHEFAIAGHYIVTLKVVNGCSDFEISLPVNVDLATGVITLDKDFGQVMLYPNPARDIIAIVLGNDQTKIEQVVVYNVLGGIVYRDKASNDKKQELSVAHLPSGIYSVRIQTSKGFIARKFEVLK